MSYGDPQITTLDGHVYSFNGRGEYIFMRVKNRYVYYALYEPPCDKTNTVYLPRLGLAKQRQYFQKDREG